MYMYICIYVGVCLYVYVYDIYKYIYFFEIDFSFCYNQYMVRNFDVVKDLLINFDIANLNFCSLYADQH